MSGQQLKYPAKRIEYVKIPVHLHKSYTEILTPKGDGIRIRRWGLWEEIES